MNFSAINLVETVSGPPESSPTSTAMSAKESRRAYLYVETNSPSANSRWRFVRNCSCCLAEGAAIPALTPAQVRGLHRQRVDAGRRETSLDSIVTRSARQCVEPCTRDWGCSLMTQELDKDRQALLDAKMAVVT